MAVSKTLYVRLAANVTGFSAGMGAAATSVEAFERRVTGSTTRASNSIGTLAQKARLGLGIAVAVAFTAAIKASAEFEKNMRNVNSISGLSEKRLATLSQQVIDLSKNLPTSAADLSSGLYDIASSGFQGSEGLKVLKASATAASAGLSTTATAGRAIAGVLNAYGKSADEAADVSDTLFQAVNVGVVSFDELANNLGDFVGTAAAAKVPIDDASAALAAITLSGISGAEAATALNQTLTALLKPSKQMAGALHDMGYESGAQALEVDGLQKVMHRLRDYTGGSADKVIDLFRNVRASKGALALMANDGRNFSKSMKAVADESTRAGSTQRVLAEQAKSLSYQWDIFRNRIMAVAIEIGSHITPEIAHLLASLGSLNDTAAFDALLPFFVSLWHAIQNLVDIAQGLGDTFGPFIEDLAKLGGGAVVGTLRLLASTLATLTGFLADHKTLVEAVAILYGARLVSAFLLARGGAVGLAWSLGNVLAGGILKTTTAAGTLKTGLLSMLNPVTLVAAALIGSAVSITAEWHRVSQAAKDAKTALSDVQTGIPDAGSLEDFQKGIAGATKSVADLYDAAGASGPSINPLKNIATIANSVTGHYDDARKSILETQGALQQMSGSVERIDAMLGGTNTAASMQRTWGTIQHAIEAGAVSADDFKDAVDRSLAGDYTGWDELVAKIKAYRDGAGSSTGPTKELDDAIGGLGSAASDAEQEISDLKTALDLLVGAPIAVEEAMIASRQAIAELAKTAKEAGSTSLNDLTAAGQANVQAIDKAASSILDYEDALAKQGKTAEEIKPLVMERVKSLRSEMLQTYGNKKAVDDLLSGYNLLPKQIRTIMTTPGMRQAAADAKAAADELERTKAAADRMRHMQVVIDIVAQQSPQTARLLRQDLVGGNAAGGYIGRASGGFVSGPGGPTDDKVPALLSNGEYVLRSSAVKAIGVGTLEKMNRFASGGHVGAHPARLDRRIDRIMSSIGPGASSSAIDRAIAKVQTLLDHWNQAVQHLQDAAQRADLVKSLHAAEREYAKTKNDKKAKPSEVHDAAKAVADARRQLREFDAEARRSAAERRAEAKQRRLEEKQTIANNRDQWRFERMTSEEQIDYLTKRMHHEKRFSDEWMRDAEQRRQITQQIREIERQITDNRKQWHYDHESAAQQLADTLKQLDAVKRYSDEWMNLAQQAESLRDDAISAQTDAFNTLNDLLDRAEEIHSQQVEAAADLARAQASAWSDYSKSVAQAMDDATDKIRSYMALTERVTSDPTFDVTTTDEAGARSTLRALGLLTEAMQAYDDAVSQAPSAKSLIANAREQADQILEWSTKLEELRNRGLSEDVIAALGLEDSPAALGQVRALSTATQSELAELNAAVKAKNDAASKAAQDEASRSMSALGQQLLGYRATLNGALSAAQADYAEKMAEYQKELDELGTDTGRTYADAIAAGLASGLPGVQAAAGALVAAMAAAAKAIAAVTAATTDPKKTDGKKTDTKTGQKTTTTKNPYDSWAWDKWGHWAGGGAVRGPGTSTSDSVKARLSNGEYVLRASAVRTIGVGALDQMNRYADGGLVGSTPVRAQRAVASPGSTVIVEQRNDFSFEIDARGAMSGVGDEIEAALRDYTDDIVVALRAEVGTR